MDEGLGQVLSGTRPWWVECGDALTALRAMPDGVVHCCVTSPPYFGLRSYLPDGHADKAREVGLEDTPDSYVARLVGVFREVRRVLHPSGVLWLNLGDSYVNNPGNGRGGEFSGLRRGGPHRSAADKTRCGLKPKDLLMIPARVALALQADGWWLRQALPWVKRCLSGGTWVYARTQKGDMPMTLKDLVRLRPETVQLWDGGKWTQVKGFSKTVPEKGAGRAGYFELEFRTGERVGCTAEHVWPTERGNVRADELRVGDVIQRARLPEPDRPAVPACVPDDLVGWFVGTYLADGYRQEGSIHITSHVNETARLERLRLLAAAYHGTCRLQVREGNCVNIDLAGPLLLAIVDAYVSGRDAYTKHLTARCWQRSNGFLRALLDGYLQGDGHFDAKNDRWRLGFTNNDLLAQDLRCLGARLGAAVRLRRARHKMDGRTFPGWKGEIRFRRKENVPGGFPARPETEVVAIRASRARCYWDVEVADEPHLFALASGVLTHNSAMPEGVTDRPANALEQVFLLTRSPSYYLDMEAVRRPAARVQETPVRFGSNKAAGYGSRLYSGREYTGGEAGRNFRNADLWFESAAAPHGLCGVGGELVGLDVTSEPFTWEEISRQVRVEAGAVSGGTTRKVSADCPLHGGPPAPAATESCDGHEGLPPSRSPDNDSRPVPGQRGGSEPTVPPPARCSAVQNSDSSPPACESPATGRSSRSRRKAPVPETSPPCTLFSQTDTGTGDTSGSPDSAAPGPSTPGNSTSEPDAPSGPASQSSGRSDDTRQLPLASIEDLRVAGCTCEYYRTIYEKTSHFAVMPTGLVRPLVLAGTSERGCCPRCLAPWRRVVERERRPTRPGADSKVYEPDPAKKQDALGKNTYTGFNERWRGAKEVGNRDPQRHCTETRTLGWAPGCDCYGVPALPPAPDDDAPAPEWEAWRAARDRLLALYEPLPAAPARVLDPFAGSGTVGLVARRLGRRFVGVDLSPEYVAMARRRIGGATPLFDWGGTSAEES